MMNRFQVILSALLMLLVFPQALAAADSNLHLKSMLPQTGYYPIIKPGGVAVDSAANVYVADSQGNRILKISSAGVLLTTIGEPGDGPGQFNYPSGVAVDLTGQTVYVADMGNWRIQKFTYNAGSGTYTYATQWDGSASGSGFYAPKGVAVDGAGNVYVADTYNHRIVKFDSSGTYLAQWGSYGSDPGQFNYPAGVAADSSGNFYVADTSNSRIQKCDSSASTWTVWGSYGTGNGEFNYPAGVAVDSAGNIFVADTGNDRFQVFDSSAATWNSWGGSGSGIGQFSSPQGIAVYRVSSTTGVFVADTNNARIQKYNYWVNGSFGPTVTYLGQLGSRGSGNGQFNQPNGVALDGAGNLYVADTYNDRIQKFAYDSGSGTYAYATQWGGSGSGDGQFSSPCGVAVDSAGNVFVADTGNSRIQKYDYSTSTWGSFGFGTTQNGPYGVAVDSAGNVFVADSYNNRIQKFDSTGQLKAQWGFGGQGDGQFYYPTTVTVDSAGNVYVADFDNQRIEKFTPNASGGYNYQTQWGGYGRDNGHFDGPVGVAADRLGGIYVTDCYNYRVQKFSTNGNFRGAWNSFIPGAGQFYKPMGVVAGGGNLIVADSDSSTVLIFSAPSPALPMIGLLLD